MSFSGVLSLERKQNRVSGQERLLQEALHPQECRVGVDLGSAPLILLVCEEVAHSIFDGHVMYRSRAPFW